MAEINQNVKSDSTDKDVKNALTVIEDNYSERVKQDEIIDTLQELFREAFLIKDPKGTRQIGSQRLYQALWRTAGRMKPLDFMIHGEGKDELYERIVTAGVGTVLDKGGYDSCLRDKNGAFFDLLLYGDSIIQVGTNDNENSSIPINFSCVPNKNVFVDNTATAIRATGKGRSAQKMVVIYSYSWDEFARIYPKMKKKAGLGRIPRNYSKDQTLTAEQEVNKGDFVEVAHSYDLTTKTYTVFAGTATTIIDKFKGDAYPFALDGEDYIPLTQLSCVPSSEGFWNYGLGHLLYRLAIISRQLLNMEVLHIKDNVLPIELVNVAQGNASMFFQRLKSANELRAKGQRGYLTMERGAGDVSGNTVSSQSLTTQNLFNEWQAVFDRLDQEIRRLGVNIDELDTGATKTATEILALEENANAFVKQIMEWSASESQKMVEITMDFIRKFVSKKDRSPLNLTTKFEIEGEEARLDKLTLGMVATELKENHYFVKINSRTGAIPSNTMMIAKLSAMFPLAAPGSSAQKKLIDALARVNDLDIKGEEFLQPAQPTEAAEGPPAEEEVDLAPPTGTDRRSINPFLREPQAAI